MQRHKHHGVDDEVGLAAAGGAHAKSSEDATEGDSGTSASPFGGLFLIRIVFCTTPLCTSECASLPGARVRQYGLRLDLSLAVVSTKIWWWVSMPSS